MSNTINFSIFPAECERCLNEISSELEVSSRFTGVVPSLTENNLTNPVGYKLFLDYLKTLYIPNALSSIPTFNTYTYPVPPGNEADYAGGAYSPTQNRIYLSPIFALNPPTNLWDYIDCETGQMIKYTNNSGQPLFSNQAYAGGAYSSKHNRIYFLPRSQSAAGWWHYIDCNTGDVVAYPTPVLIPFAYAGGIYCVDLDRIYLSPSEQSVLSNRWHYIDCSNNTVVEYQAVSGLPQQSYAGAVLCPTMNRIYFVPYRFVTGPFQYIDCTTGTLGEWFNNSGVPIIEGGIDQGAYASGIYSPVQNRVYFSPNYMAAYPQLHYLDCNDGNLKVYSKNPNLSVGEVLLGTYVPVVNKIFFSPFFNANTNKRRYYIDCEDGVMKDYFDNSGLTLNFLPYEGCIFSPLNNRLYFIPFGEYNTGSSQYLYFPVGNTASPQLIANSIINAL